MWDNFPWAQALVSLAFFGIGFIEIHTGYALGRGGGYTPDNSPFMYWSEIGFNFFLGAMFAYLGVKEFLGDRKLFANNTTNDEIHK
jgi:hypothetical protein